MSGKSKSSSMSAVDLLNLKESNEHFTIEDGVITSKLTNMFLPMDMIHKHTVDEFTMRKDMNMSIPTANEFFNQVLKENKMEYVQALEVADVITRKWGYNCFLHGILIRDREKGVQIRVNDRKAVEWLESQDRDKTRECPFLTVTDIDVKKAK